MVQEVRKLVPDLFTVCIYLPDDPVTFVPATGGITKTIIIAWAKSLQKTTESTDITFVMKDLSQI